MATHANNTKTPSNGAKRTMRTTKRSRFCGLFVFGLMLSLASVEAQAQNASPLLGASDHARFQKALEFLDRWRPEEAETQLKPVLERHPKNKQVLLVLARLRYYQGRYQEALNIYHNAADAAYLKKHSTYQSLKATHKLTKNYKHKRSKHFEIAYPPGKDEILVTYALEALEKAYARLSKLYQYNSKTPVRIEFLRDSLELAAVSPLTQMDILRTGTIALCKYNRLMITSPRALLRGYRWLDTLVHEYTHLIINRVVAGIPIWLHEGLARYSQALWRLPGPEPLSPYSRSILADALKRDKLITFKQMHPSMAKLPSQRDAALAYAQVYSVIVYFVKKRGATGIPRVLKLVHDGHSIPKAFSLTLATPFPIFLNQWKTHMQKKRLPIIKDLLPPKKILKKHRHQQQQAKKKRPKKDFWSRPNSPEKWGQRYLELAEMLRARGRRKAALKEYTKAVKHWKNKNPKLQNKIAMTHFSLRQYKEAIAPLRSSLELYPNYFTTHYHLGRAYFGMRKFAQARKAFEEANQINPFHPRIHDYLIFLYRKGKQELLLKREIRVRARLRKPED